MVGKGLLCKHEHRSLVPKTHITKSGMVVCPLKAAVRKRGQLSVAAKFQASGALRNTARGLHVHTTCTHPRTHIYKQEYVHTEQGIKYNEVDELDQSFQYLKYIRKRLVIIERATRNARYCLVLFLEHFLRVERQKGSHGVLRM